MYKSSLLILLACCSLILFGFSIKSNIIDNYDAILSEENEIEWITIEEAMELHSKNPKYWIIDIYTDWCGWCKRMDATTFKDPYVTEEINKNYYAVKFNAEAKRDIVVGDKTYKKVV